MSLVPCVRCGCHVRREETECPHCGAGDFRPVGGRMTRAAVFAGLVLSAGACGDGTEGDEDDGEGGAGGQVIGNTGGVYGAGASWGTVGGAPSNVGGVYGAAMTGGFPANGGAGGETGGGGVGGDGAGGDVMGGGSDGAP